MNLHRLIIGSMFFIIGVVFCLILIRIYGRFSNVEVEAWQQVIFTVMVAIAALQLMTGYCIIVDKPWPSKICIFIAAFDLVIFPIGTFAGVYYFWYFVKSNNSLGRQSNNYSR